ncbi:MAG: hypothetical protein OSA98_20545, partial [Rubripirellula sp.]|nr:hypothetical protein [Rubripirellula sp.]
ASRTQPHYQPRFSHSTWCKDRGVVSWNDLAIEQVGTPAIWGQWQTARIGMRAVRWRENGVAHHSADHS